MNSLQECVNEYIKDGYTRNYAISKVCQDIIINRIYNSKYNDKITISDNYNKSYRIKLDIGVHKHIDILQDTLLLDTKIK